MRLAALLVLLATAASAQIQTPRPPIPDRRLELTVPTVGPLNVSPRSNSRLVALHGWYSPSRGDNRTTTDPAWRGGPGATHDPDYRWSGIEGYVLDPALPPPPGTVPLYTWYSPDRKDHHLSSDPRYRPASDADRARDPDYRLVRLEGYVYEAALAGTFPLQSHWSLDRGDNHATTRAVMLGAIGDTPEPGYRLFRTEGYVVAPEHEAVRPYDAERLGIGRVSFGHEEGVPVHGSRPLLVILLEYADVRLRAPAATFEDRLWRSDRSVDRYVRQLSRNRFRWTRAGVLGPYRPADDPATPFDDTQFNCFARTSWDHDADPATPNVPVCPGATGAWEPGLATAIRMADRDIDFSRYDDNRDGRIDGQELGVLVIGAQPPMLGRDVARYPVTSATGGATRFAGNGPRNYGDCVAADGVRVCGPVSTVAEGSSLTTTVHELMHELDTGADHDLYGGIPRQGSEWASLMSDRAAQTEDQTTSVLLDPWHATRLGWYDPVVRPIHPAVPPAAARLLIPSLGSSIDPHPVVFFDPRRGYRETFLLEYRLPQGFDANVGDDGVALWYARTTDTFTPPQLPNEIAGTGSRQWDPSQVGKAVWTIGASDQTRGRSQFWTAGHGEIATRWYAATPRPGAPVVAGPESGLRFRVGNAPRLGDDPHSIDVEWRTSDAPFLPRIDGVEVSGESLVLQGEFGVHGAKAVWLAPTGGGAPERLDVERWMTDAVRARLPDRLVAGTYALRVCTDATRAACGNAHELAVGGRGGPD